LIHTNLLSFLSKAYWCSSLLLILGCWWLVFHLISLELLLTYRYMSFSRLLIKLSITPLTFSSIIVLLWWGLMNSSFSSSNSSTIINSSSSHGLSKHFTLSFPLSSLWLLNGLVLLRLSFCFLLLLISLFRWRLVRPIIILCFIFDLPLLLDIEYLSLLHKYLFAYFLMLLQSLLYEFPTTSWAFYSISCILWILIWQLLSKLIYCSLIVITILVLIIILISFFIYFFILILILIVIELFLIALFVIALFLIVALL